MTYNVFCGTLNPTLLLSASAEQHCLNSLHKSYTYTSHIHIAYILYTVITVVVSLHFI